MVVRTLTKGVTTAVDTLNGQIKAAPRQVFARELNYQVYRIENVLNVKDPELVSAFVKKNPEYANRPLLQRFFESYKNKNINEFVESAKGKTQAEREKLLEGIRRIIYKAKKEKHVAKTKVEKAPKAKEQDEKIARLEGLLKKEYTPQDFHRVEKNISTPFDISKGKVDFNKVRYFYTSILTGQKGFGSHIQGMQKEYTGAVNQLKSYQKQYTSNTSWKKYAGTIDYGWRKVKGLFSWGKKKLGYKVDTSRKDRINASVAKARTYYSNRINKVKRMKTHIANRTVELKKGLGVFRGDLREKIKGMIVRGEWTQEQQKKSEKAKEAIQNKKAQLASGLSRAKLQRLGIEKTQKGVGRMQVGLVDKLKKVKLSGPLLNKKVVAVKKRIKQLEKQYDKKDPRVLEMRKVLMGLLKGQDRIAQVKEGTAAQLSDAETKFHSLDILKANIYLSETDIVDQIEKNELAFSHTTKRIDQLKQNRLEIHKVLEGMETAYVAVDEFKGNVSKNLNKMNNTNTKAVKGIDAQYKYLQQAKAVDPGIGTALYNTVGIGRWGAMGVLKYGVNYIPSYIAYFANGRDWEAAKKWSVTGALGQLQNKFDGWLHKDGFRQYGRDNGLWQIAATGFNSVAGVANTALSLVNGVGTLVFETEKVLDSLGMMVTDWGMFKEALKGVIHYKDWTEGRADIAFGKTAGDLIVLFLTAGASAGAQAAAKVASTASKVAKLGMYMKGFMKEVARQSWNLPKNAYKFVASVPKMALGALKTTAGVIHAVRTGGMQGLRNFLYDVKFSNAKLASIDDVQNYVKGLSPKKLQRLNPSTRKMLENVIKNPNQARLQKLMGRLETEFYKGGWRTRQILGPLQGKLKRYIKLDIKHMKGKEFLRQKYGSLELAKGMSKEATASGNMMARYQAAKAELAEANKIELPKRGKGVTNNMIKKAKNKKVAAIEKAKTTLAKEKKLLEGRYDTMRVSKGTLKESVSTEEAMFRYRKAKVELAKAKEMKVPRTGKNINSARLKRRSAISKAKRRLVQEKELLNNVKGSTQEILKSADDLISKMGETKPQGFFEKMGAKSRLKEAIRRLELESEFGINVGNRITKLKESLNGIRIFEKGAQAAEVAEKGARVTMLERLKSARAMVKTKGIKEATKFLFHNVAAWPVWLSSRSFIGLRTINKEILVASKGKGAQMLSNVTRMRAVAETSSNINKLLKQGYIKAAVELYYAARINAHRIGIPFAAMDKSFIGYLHKVMPLTVTYLGRVEDLNNLGKIAKLPTKLVVDKKQFAALQKKNLDLMKKYKM